MEIDVLRKIDELGRIVLPPDFRRALLIKEGHILRILIKDNHLEIYPIKDKE